ncbi:MAG: serine/threonine protein kinase, partial [Betaproteobacteria bacterium]
MPAEPPYSGLTPDTVLDALASAGFAGDGRLLGLNSYENRVYQVWLEAEETPNSPASVVAKFYRPARWTDAQILEEHAFTLELVEREIPVVAPLEANGETLHRFGGFRFAVFPRRGGRTPELEDRKTLEWIGRFIGRTHAAGATRAFADRPTLGIESFGREPRDWLLAHDFIPKDLLDAWKSAVDLALAGVAHSYERAGEVRALRLHGDCHAGNVLWTDEGPHFVDFDDCRNGPAVQDLWMLLS